MAGKKKLQTAPSVAAVEDSSEQLKLLKSFNFKLIKETAAARAFIEAFEREKKMLEAELASLEREKSVLLRSLEAEKEKVARACEETDSLKTEVASFKERETIVKEEAQRLRAELKDAQRKNSVKETLMAKTAATMEWFKAEKAIGETVRMRGRFWAVVSAAATISLFVVALVAYCQN